MPYANNPYSPNNAPRHNSKTRRRIKMIEESEEFNHGTNYNKREIKQKAPFSVRYSGRDKQFYY